MSKVWFVTGSSRGLGRTVAEAALAAGASVVATATARRWLEYGITRDPNIYGLQRLAALLESKGGNPPSRSAGRLR